MSRGRPLRSFPLPWLALLLAAALGLRLAGLGDRGLWLDEWVSLQVAAEPWIEVALGRVFDNHTPPLYYLLLHAWFGVVPAGVTGLRLASVLLDVLALGLFTLVVHRWLGRRVALLAGAGWAVSPFAVRLAQEGRMYPLLLLLLVATFGLALEVGAGRERRWPAVAVAVTAAAALYTHYYAALFLLVLHAAMAWRLRAEPSRARRWWGAMGAAALAFLPWVPVVAGLLRSGGQVYRPFGAAVLPYGLFRLFLGWAVLPLDVEAKRHVAATVLAHLPLLVAVAVALAGVLLLGATRAWRGPSPDGRIVLALAGVPPVLALAMTLVLPSLDARYLSISFPFLLLVAALAPWGRWRPRWWAPVQVLALALFAFAAAAHVANPAAGSTPWPQAAAELRRAAEPGALVVVHPPFYAPLAGHHLGGEVRVGTVEELEPSAAETWLLEVAFLSRAAPRLHGEGWRVTPYRLLPSGNGLRISRLRRRDGGAVPPR